MILQRRRSFCLATAVLLFSLAAAAQFPFTRLYYPLGENESHNVQRLFQDRTGFIWMGTTGGVFFFDGFESHRLAATDTGANPLVATAFAEAPDGKLWIGFADGRLGFVSRYTLHLLDPEEGMPQQPVSAVAFDSHKRVWFATLGEGIYVYDSKRIYNINRDDALPDDNVHALLFRNGRMWAGTERGLVNVEFENGKKTLQTFGTAQGLPDAVVTALGVDRFNRMWLGLLDNGMALFDDATRAFHTPSAFQGWDKGRVRNMQWAGARSWLVTDYQGIWVFDAALDTVFAQPLEGLPAMRYQDVLLDREGLVWLCTANRLYKTTGDLLQHFPLQADGNENVQAVLARRSGELWFATNRGLFELRNGIPTKLAFSNASLNNVLSMYEDDGDVWIGTFGDGLWRYSARTRELNRLGKTDGLPDNSILFVTGNADAIWLATLGGVSRMRIVNGKPLFQNFSEADGLQSAYVYSIFIDSKKRVWFGTDGRGLNVWDGARFVNPVKRGTLNAQVVYSIVEDAAGRMWVATARNGLYRLDGDSAINYGTAQGLDDYNVTALAADSTGNVFVMHNDGFECLNTLTEQFTFYGRLMNANDLQAGLNAVAVANNDVLWAGMRNGLLRFQPLDARKRIGPLAVLREINVLSDGEPAGNDSVFSYTQNFLQFRYEAIWNTDPEALTFQYRLSGDANTGWITTRDRDVVLPRLDAGKYQMEMQAGLVGAYNASRILTYPFAVEPAWWQRWWFYVLLSAAAVGLIMGGIRWRERTLQQQQQLAQLRLRTEYETLRNQVNPHFLFNSFNTLAAAIEDDPPSAVEYVQHMSDFFRRMLEVREKPLVSLEDELELTRHYLFLQQKRYGSNFSVSNEIGDRMERYALPPLTLQLLLENAFKHNAVSRSTPLRIRLAVENDALVVSNSLSPKPHRESGTGIGLDNIRNRVRLLGRGEVVCERTDATFTVIVPLVENVVV